MIKFLNSKNAYDEFLKKYKPNKSVIICSPFMTSKLFFDYYSFLDIGNNNISFNLMYRGKINDFLLGSFDFKIIEKLFNDSNIDNSKIYRNTRLHMKAYCVDNRYLFVTSGNFTSSGFSYSVIGNDEGGILTDDDKIIKAFLDYYSSLINRKSNKYDEGVPANLDTFFPILKSKYPEIKERKKQLKSKSINTEFIKQVEDIIDSKVSNIDKTSFVKSDLPNICYTSNVEDYLLLLDANGPFQSKKDFGEEIRKLDGYPPASSNTNGKYGQEKADFLSYFQLAETTNINGTNQKVQITELGKTFIVLDDAERAALYLTACLRSPAVRLLMQECSSVNEIRNCLYSNFSNEPSTLDRYIGSLSDLFNFISNNLDPVTFDQQFSVDVSKLKILNDNN